VRLWRNKFGPLFSKRLKRRHPRFGDTFFIDEVFVTITGRRHYLWRAVDQDGDVVDVYLQARKPRRAAGPPGRTGYSTQRVVCVSPRIVRKPKNGSMFIPSKVVSK
jgi:hypothetical protein